MAYVKTAGVGIVRLGVSSFQAERIRWVVGEQPRERGKDVEDWKDRIDAPVGGSTVQLFIYKDDLT